MACEESSIVADQVMELLESRRPQGRAHAEISARVLRRSAAAHRHRSRPRGVAEAHRVRRAGIGAGRLDPGPDHQSAGRIFRSSSRCPICSSHTICRLLAYPHACRRDVSRPDSGAGPDPQSLLRTRAIRLYQGLMAAIPIPDPTKKRERIRCKAIRPTRSHRRQDVISTPAVRSVNCRSVQPRSPSCDRVREGHWVACHLRG